MISHSPWHIKLLLFAPLWLKQPCAWTYKISQLIKAAVCLVFAAAGCFPSVWLFSSGQGPSFGSGARGPFNKIIPGSPYEKCYCFLSWWNKITVGRESHMKISNIVLALLNLHELVSSCPPFKPSGLNHIH